MIRRLVPEDEEAFCELIRCFVVERMGPFGILPDDDVSHAQFKVMVTDPAIVGLVIENDEGGLDGCIVVAYAPLLFCKGMIAQELVWYVRPTSRGFDGLRMLKEITKISFEKGCFGIMMISMAGDRANDYYARNGYMPLQNIYFKVIGDNL